MEGEDTVWKIYKAFCCEIEGVLGENVVEGGFLDEGRSGGCHA